MLDSRFISKIRLERPEKAEGHPWDIPSLASLEELEFHPGLTFFIGENGSGKSTLLEALAVAAGLNAEGGSQQHRFSTRDTHSTLHAHLQLVRGWKRPKERFFLRAESFYNTSSYFQDVGVINFPEMHGRSHGEAFLALMQTLKPDGLYFFDEPESALSPQRQLVFLTEMHRLIARGCQFVIATHSPILLCYRPCLCYHFSDEGIQPIDPRDSEHVSLTRSILMNPDQALKHLKSPPRQTEASP
ncbi:MAG: hypothetical protein RL095_2968 [Verrucomicrobiota bacterium]|jgi:predicted ATPase